MKNPILGLGDKLFSICQTSMLDLHSLGELAQFSHYSFERTVKTLKDSESEFFIIKYPVGRKANNRTLFKKQQYTREDAVSKFQHIAGHQTPKNGIIQMTICIEGFLFELVRAVVTKYPQKMGKKRSITLDKILSAQTINEVYNTAIGEFIYKLTYEGPTEYVTNLDSILSTSLKDCPLFWSFVEMKSTRDVYIHNGGVVNDLYIRKSRDLSRAQKGQILLIDHDYFLEKYEHCLQLIDAVQTSLNETWPSQNFRSSRMPGEPGSSGFWCPKDGQSAFHRELPSKFE